MKIYPVLILTVWSCAEWGRVDGQFPQFGMQSAIPHFSAPPQMPEFNLVPNRGSNRGPQAHHERRPLRQPSSGTPFQTPVSLPPNPASKIEFPQEDRDQQENFDIPADQSDSM